MSIKYSNCSVNADYLAAIEEWMFLNENDGLGDVSSVVEIGAGFGRTCHTLLTLSPQIEEYSIIELDQMLNLSKKYLGKVAPELIGRVKFISSENLDIQMQLRCDLAINIDSFQEMPLPIIHGYMKRVVRRADKFYCKNPVGKYLSETVGMSELGADNLLDVFKLGRCTNVVDIFCENGLNDARKKYLHEYCPPPYDVQDIYMPYKVTAVKAMELFPYFHHALFERN